MVRHEGAPCMYVLKINEHPIPFPLSTSFLFSSSFSPSFFLFLLTFTACNETRSVHLMANNEDFHLSRLVCFESLLWPFQISPFFAIGNEERCVSDTLSVKFIFIFSFSFHLFIFHLLRCVIMITLLRRVLKQTVRYRYRGALSRVHDKEHALLCFNWYHG